MAVTKQVLVCVGMSNGIVSLCSDKIVEIGGQQVGFDTVGHPKPISQTLPPIVPGGAIHWPLHYL